MTIQHENDEKKGAFYVEENGDRLAEMTYVWAGTERFIIDHTEVDDRLAGKGVGKALVSQAVEYAREKGIRISATCPFARSVFMKTPEWNDVTG